MIERPHLSTLLWVLAALAALAGPVRAHPHVWVNVETVVLYDDAGRVAGMRHQWTFDEFYSAFAAQGLDANGDGAFDRDELRGLAEENVTSLKEFDYFTFVKAGGGDAAISEPEDYWLDHVNGVLVLNFTLPLAKPIDAREVATRLSIYDPTYFVAFSFAERDPVRLAAMAPEGCAVALERRESPKVESASLTESFFNSLDAGSEFGSKFAQTAAITCDGR